MVEELRYNIDELNTILTHIGSKVKYDLSYSSCYYTLLKVVNGEVLTVMRSTFSDVNRHVFTLKDMFETLMYSQLGK